MSATAEDFKDAGLGRWVWWAHQKLEAMENRSERGPDDFENRYTAPEMEFLIKAALKERYGSQYGGIQGGGSNNKNTLLLSINIAILLSGGGWVISTLIDHGQQLAQIRCQLNPGTCLQLPVPHGR